VIDLEEALCPTNYPFGFTARKMRWIWKRAAWFYLRQHWWGYAWEAYFNNWKRFPPTHWNSGAPLI
jgi:hypothetical protein